VRHGVTVTPGPLTDTQLPIAEQEAMANLDDYVLFVHSGSH